MSDRFLVDIINVGSALVALLMMFYSYYKFRQKVLSLFAMYIVFFANFHILIFYCVVLFSRWMWGVKISMFFQDWSSILRFLTILFFGAFVVFVADLHSKGGKHL